MMSPDSFYFQKMQEVITDPHGRITHSNNSIFTVGKGHNIFKIHPFFESLQQSILSTNQQYFSFPCVNLTVEDKTYYCDIIIKQEPGFLAILIFNYSDRYKELQEKVQKNNSEKLNS